MFFAVSSLSRDLENLFQMWIGREELDFVDSFFWKGGGGIDGNKRRFYCEILTSKAQLRM